MEADIYDVGKFIQVNKLKEVTNPIIFNRGNIPTPDGLLSTEIFGRTPEDRQTIWAYITLGGHFLHPVVYKDLLRIDRRLEGLINGVDYYELNAKGELVASDETKGNTGLEYLYKIWENIKWKRKESNFAQERIKLLKALDKNEAFMQYIPVCPAFYRDVNLSDQDTGKVAVGEINQSYSKIIRLSNAIKHDTTGLDIVGHSTRMVIQREIVGIYDFFTGDIKGKNGLFRKFVLGVSVDYGARLVMSNARYIQDKHTDMMVDFQHSGIPLATCCVIFYPFVLKWVKDLFYNEFFLKKKKSFINAKGEIDTVEIKNPENIVSDEYISKAIDSYIHSYADRFKKVEVDTADGKKMVIAVSGYYQDAKGGNFESSTIIKRPATWTDILYMACVDVTRDKHVLITRYPIESPFASITTKITVVSTKDTRPAVINNKVYPHYPVVDPSLPPNVVSTKFIDTLNISNLYLEGLGGDYDGDQVTVRGIFTQEANKEAEGHMYSKKNLLTVVGQNIRYTTKEAVQAIYNFTKTHP